MENQISRNISPDHGTYQLKWHKFLIYFALWASALISLGTAFRYFTGMIYGSNANAVYSYYGGMKTLDMIMGIILVGLAVLSVYVRFQLSGFKTDAPKKLEYLYIANAAVPLLYLLAASSVTGISFFDLASDSWGSLIGSIAMIFVNRTYYSKREALFVN